MGQDGIYLQVLAQDENDSQQKNARRVYDLLDKGKHWVLVTLLLSNVIVNETLPVVLDRCFGGGVAAVVGSTFLIGTYRIPTVTLVPVRELMVCLQSSLARSFPSQYACGMVFRLEDICRSPFSSSCG